MDICSAVARAQTDIQSEQLAAMLDFVVVRPGRESRMRILKRRQPHRKRGAIPLGPAKNIQH
jgi:hypothetical protein